MTLGVLITEKSTKILLIKAMTVQQKGVFFRVACWQKCLDCLFVDNMAAFLVTFSVSFSLTFSECN